MWLPVAPMGAVRDEALRSVVIVGPKKGTGTFYANGRFGALRARNGEKVPVPFSLTAALRYAEASGNTVR